MGLLNTWILLFCVGAEQKGSELKKVEGCNKNGGFKF